MVLHLIPAKVPLFSCPNDGILSINMNTTGNFASEVRLVRREDVLVFSEYIINIDLKM